MMLWFILAWAIVVVCGAVGSFFAIDYSYAEATRVEIVRNMSIIAAGAISFPAVLYSLWMKKADLTIR